MKVVRATGIALAALASALCFGQAGKVLEGKDISESALVNALKPEPPKVRTRSIKVTREEAPAPAPSASLLITFETSSAQLTPEARHSLEVVARALKSGELAPFRFVVEGHADPRGGEAFNLKLSQARAESVVNYLVDTQSVERARLNAVGKGQSELMNAANPIAPENRRVTIKTLSN